MSTFYTLAQAVEKLVIAFFRVDNMQDVVQIIDTAEGTHEVRVKTGDGKRYKITIEELK